MIINHNLMANNAIRNANINSTNASKSMQKLSSGLRINSAADDAAGLAISEKMRGQIRGLDQASSNAQDAISMTQTSEGALNETQSILQRMRELATQSANDTNVTVDRTSIQKEMNQLTSEINRIGNTTEFNTQKVLNGGGDDNGEWSAKVTGGTIGTEVLVSGGSALAPGAISLNVDGQDYSVNITSGTLIASAINAINSAVGTNVASITMNADGSGELVLQSKAGNATGSIQITGATGAAAKSTGTGLALTATTLENRTFATKQGTAASITGGTIATGIASGATGSSLAPGALTIEVDGKNYSVNITSGTMIASAITAINSAVGTNVASITSNADGSGSLTLKSTTLSKDSKIQIIGSTGTASTSLKLTSGSEVKGEDANFNATMQIGANQGQNFTISIGDMRAAALRVSGAAGNQIGFTKDGQSFTAKFTSTNSVTDGTTTTLQEAALDISTKDNATAAIKVLDDAINSVSSQRSELGAAQNRLEHTINNLGTSSENLTSAESRIRDVDMAKEMSTFSKNNILSQAAQAMLAQANQQPQQVLSLLR
ncbi:hypothetical protein LF65_04812 [Clostridium beijerinckii]|uniref:Flagellin n=1 Tax=Clostridium beijerinckii TaxID=1520 RepID=A0A0B5QK88_CLOBE|nr:flagellin [Clostridium beijerinckii]AJH01341.1 hypothetical protein LF65_04812 [Clostridium beijerinckii]